VLYGKVKTFVRDNLFEQSPVDMEDPVVLRNLSEPEVSKVLFDGFRAAINTLTIQDTGTSRIEDWIKLKDTRPFRTENRPFLYAQKSVFNKVVAEPRTGGFELSFAGFLDADDNGVASFSKNYLAVGFKLDYVRADGELSNHIPDFFVRGTDGTVWIIETKGREEIDLPQKMKRLKQWCEDATASSALDGGPAYRFIYVDQKSFEQHRPATLAALAAAFTEYQS
jgi:type III restriction enzyme